MKPNYAKNGKLRKCSVIYFSFTPLTDFSVWKVGQSDKHLLALCI